ncbi:FtsK/SpoIIIE domain-containing protein [Fodinibacter luteus]
MEMTLTVHVPRRRPFPVDVVVEWVGEHSAADLCAALGDHLGEPVPGLSSRGVTVDPHGLVGMPPLLHGASVTVVGGPVLPVGRRGTGGVLELVAASGPDAGRSRPLVPPGLVVGRATGTGLDLADEGLSRVHAVFEVGPAGVTVRDVDSTNGVLVDGSRVDGVTVVDAGSTIVLGSTTLRIRRSAGHGLPETPAGDGTLVVRPSATATPLTAPVEVECPQPPPERHRTRIPWVAAIAPVPVAVALAFLLGPQLLLFAAFGPVVLVATALGDRWGAGRAHRRAVEVHAQAVRAARTRLEQALAHEAARLHHTHPDPHVVVTTAEHRLPGLWSGGAGMRLRIGLGAVPTRVRWAEGTRTTCPLADGVPVTVDLGQAGALAVVGGAETTRRLLTALIGQLCTAHPPHALNVAMAWVDPSWQWVSRMPHATDMGELLARGGRARGSPGPVGAAGEQAAQHPGGPTAAPSASRVLVVPAAGGVSRDADVAALVARARDAGAFVLVTVGDRASVPSGCGAVISRSDDGEYLLECDGDTLRVTLDLVGPWWGDRVSRALAPLRVRDGGVGGRWPLVLPLAEALGAERIDADEVLARWDAGGEAGAGPRAVVGVGADGPFTVDLRRDGPHVLVGGTTGSGKSEFLRTLVTSLAVACPPDDLTFVLVDFKGGAAFGGCSDLPHVVGLVTDLDEHLVTRALASLGAELRRRERLFAAVGASDLDAYRAQPRAEREQVPRLVVVIDELRALVDEVPEFVSGLIRLAALGRSLGVHLVLATQRPAGAVTAEVQANVNLRIAFRVRDRADSIDVLEDPGAALLRSATPGRGLCRGGDGSLVAFHAATVEEACVEPGPSLTLRRPGAPAAVGDSSDRASGASSGYRAAPESRRRLSGARPPVVAAVVAAHRRRGGPDPRRPWLPPLPTLVTRSALLQAAGSPTVDAVRATAAVGLVDEPDLQRVSPLQWSASDGPWLLCGRPGSGRSTALRSLVLSAAAHLGPAELHVHVLDPTAALADLEQLPHLGTRIGPDDLRGLPSLADHLRHEVDCRRTGARRVPDRGEGAAETGPHPPTVLVVVDGWEQLVEAQPAGDPDGVLATLVAILRDGCSVGVVGAVSGARSLLQPRWTGLGGPTFLLGTVDPLDAALTGLRSADLPHDPPPGRAVRVRDKREAQFVASAPGDAGALAAGWGAGPHRRGAWRWRALPPVARRSEALGDAGRPASAWSSDRPDAGPHTDRPGLGSRSDRPDAGPHTDRPGLGSRSHRPGSGDALPGIGLLSPDHAVWSWHPDEIGRRLLVVGPPGSGRTNTLRVLAEAASAARRPVAVVTGAPAADGTTWAPGATLLAPDEAERLVTLRRRHPDLVVLVDDADRLAPKAPVQPVLHEIVGLADRDPGLVVVTTSTSALVTRFRGLDVEIARYRSGILLMPSPGDGDVLGVRVPTTPPRLPGRGLLVRGGGGPVELQVLLADGSVVGAGPGHDLGVRDSGGERREPGHEGQPDDEPARDDSRPLHEPPPDGQEQGAPHDRRGPRPGSIAEPAPRDSGQSHSAQQDEQRGHDDARRVASLADRELVDVERREPDQDDGLHPDERRGEAAGAA